MGNGAEEAADTSHEWDASKTQDAERIWDEYKHRHDLCWKLIFQFTVAAVVISIVPYVKADIANKLQEGILLLPLLAVAFTGLGWGRLSRELQLLGVIRRKHRDLQDLKEKDQETGFAKDVQLYFACLLFLGIVNVFVVWLIWLPAVTGNGTLQSVMWKLAVYALRRWLGDAGV
jgi:hypothetical protein